MALHHHRSQSRSFPVCRRPCRAPPLDDLGFALHLVAGMCGVCVGGSGRHRCWTSAMLGCRWAGPLGPSIYLACGARTLWGRHKVLGFPLVSTPESRRFGACAIFPSFGYSCDLRGLLFLVTWGLLGAGTHLLGCRGGFRRIRHPDVFSLPTFGRFIGRNVAFLGCRKGPVRRTGDGFGGRIVHLSPGEGQGGFL